MTQISGFKFTFYGRASEEFIFQLVKKEPQMRIDDGWLNWIFKSTSQHFNLKLWTHVPSFIILAKAKTSFTISHGNIFHFSNHSSYSILFLKGCYSIQRKSDCALENAVNCKGCIEIRLKLLTFLWRKRVFFQSISKYYSFSCIIVVFLKEYSTYFFKNSWKSLDIIRNECFLAH